MKEHLKGDVVLLYYRKGELWYRVEATGLSFPVPISDTGDGTFLPRDRAMMFMRYIKRALVDEAFTRGEP